MVVGVPASAGQSLHGPALACFVSRYARNEEDSGRLKPRHQWVLSHRFALSHPCIFECVDKLSRGWNLDQNSYDGNHHGD